MQPTSFMRTWRNPSCNCLSTWQSSPVDLSFRSIILYSMQKYKNKKQYIIVCRCFILANNFVLDIKYRNLEENIRSRIFYKRLISKFDTLLINTTSKYFSYISYSKYLPYVLIFTFELEYAFFTILNIKTLHFSHIVFTYQTTMKTV